MDLNVEEQWTSMWKSNASWSASNSWHKKQKSRELRALDGVYQFGTNRFNEAKSS